MQAQQQHGGKQRQRRRQQIQQCRRPQHLSPDLRRTARVAVRQQTKGDRQQQKGQGLRRRQFGPGQGQEGEAIGGCMR